MWFLTIKVFNSFNNQIKKVLVSEREKLQEPGWSIKFRNLSDLYLYLPLFQYHASIINLIFIVSLRSLWLKEIANTQAKDISK